MAWAFLSCDNQVRRLCKAVASLSVGPVARGPSANECIQHNGQVLLLQPRKGARARGGRAVDVWQSWRENRESRETNLLLVSKTCGTSRELSQGPRYTCEATAFATRLCYQLRMLLSNGALAPSHTSVH